MTITPSHGRLGELILTFVSAVTIAAEEKVELPMQKTSCGVSNTQGTGGHT
jgi:hypothetical protein